MTTNSQDFSLPKIIVNLYKQTEIDLFLTGSRFFGNTHSESDWDFYTGELSENQIQWLETNQFEKENMSPDMLFGRVVSVWKYQDSEAEVHILIVDNIVLRDCIQKILLEFFPYGYSEKLTNAKPIWQMAEALAFALARLNETVK